MRTVVLFNTSLFVVRNRLGQRRVRILSLSTFLSRAGTSTFHWRNGMSFKPERGLCGASGCTSPTPVCSCGGRFGGHAFDTADVESSVFVKFDV
ncbi:hypothetical protein BV22DRAFT_1034553 [Leucogyrophana mollusca]|uniref:Uncharacterized protein n=1 Tax=Leucogyrophana mollusca TaxID=85980 RepID=A0ACB8BI43_9AGAM|nr:hypothetical protein BV22DRAFT_1034553 [Leucogyrophana mollusca]